MAIAHDTQTLGPSGTDNITTGSYTTTGAQTALSHAGSASARAACVCISQTGLATDQVSGVTYGGTAMTRLRFDSEATEAGATYIYWKDGIATGTQNVVLTTTGSSIKKMVVSTMTVTSGAAVAVAGHNTGTSASVANPSWTITGLTAASALQAYEVIHSGLQTMTTTPAASWTLQESLDEGATGRGFARQAVASSGTSLACGWTAATVDDFVGSSVAFIQVALAGTGNAVLATGAGKAWNPAEVSPPLELSGFGAFTGVTAITPINAVTLTISQFATTAALGPPRVELWDGTSAQIGADQFGAVSTSTSHTDTFTFTGVTYSQLATLRVRVYGNQGAAPSGAQQAVDWVSLTVNYSATPITSVLPELVMATRIAA